MSVAQISEMHNRYVRLSDKFKSIWTYHQFVQGAVRNLLDTKVPYAIDFQKVYQPVKQAQPLIHSANPEAAGELLDVAERNFQDVVRQLLRSDEVVSASTMRRFFERLDRQDDKIILYLIKFYMYAPSLGDDQIDKLDFLLTRIAEDFIEERGEYASRDSLALRQTFQSLLSVRHGEIAREADLLPIISKLRDIKQEIDATEKFDDLTDRDLVRRLREIKHQSGEAFFHPDVLLAIVQANIAMKNRSRSLYTEEERLIMRHARRLLENERSLKEGFVASDPSLTEELERFKEFKQQFDESRASSNLKFDSLSRLKESMKRLIGDFEREPVPHPEVVEPAIEEDARRGLIEEVFGDDPMISDQLLQIVVTLAPWAEKAGSASSLARDVVSELRVEHWEAGAWIRLRHGEEMSGVVRERELLFMKGAALRMRINDEARELVHRIERDEVDRNFLVHVKSVLAAAERLDGAFATLIQGPSMRWEPEDLRRLHRSRIRLFREFSGLWLLYDQYMEENPKGPPR